MLKFLRKMQKQSKNWPGVQYPLKSLVISQLVFLLSVLPKPPHKFLKDLNSIIFNFIWSGKPDKTSRNTIIGDFEKGGLRMIHIFPLLSQVLKLHG